MSTITKGLVGKQDLSQWDGGDTTFNRATSSGGSAALDKIDFMGVDVYAIYGARSDAAISAALAVLGTTDVRKIWLAPGTWTISNDLTFASHSNVYVDCAPGATLSIASGKTLTIYSRANIIAAPGQQWVSGDGTLSCSVKEVPGYAEDFGIDGTDDHTEINAALAAYGHVKLLGNKNYATGGNITPVSNGSLIGEDFTTIITMGTDGTGIAIDSVTNFAYGGFKIVCTGRSGTVGIDISGNSSDIVQAKPVWIYDGSVHAFRIRPGADSTTCENIYLDSYLLIDSGCSSAAFTINCSSTVGNQTVTNVHIRNLHVKDTDGTGVSNNPNRTDATSDTNRINHIFYKSIHVDTCENIGWAVSAGAQRVYLDNFDIRDVQDTGAAVGNGIQIESVDGFQIKNGSVHGCKNIGIKLTHTGTIHTIYGAKRGSIEGVQIYENEGNGMILGADSSYPIFDVTIKDNKVFSNDSNGIVAYYTENLTLKDNVCFNNGGANNAKSGISFPNSSAANDHAKLIGNTSYGSDQDYGFNIGKGSVNSNITMRNNEAYDNNVTDMLLNDAAADVCDIQSEAAEFLIDLTGVAANTDEEVPISIGTGPNGAVIVDALITLDKDINPHATDYVDFVLRDKAADGQSSNKIASVDTDSGDDNITFTDFNSQSMGTVNQLSSTHKIIEPETSLSLNKNAVAGGQDIDWVSLLVKYVTY